jgi:hypothetical protein
MPILSLKNRQDAKNAKRKLLGALGVLAVHYNIN